MVDHLQSCVTRWHPYASHVKVHRTALKMDVRQRFYGTGSVWNRYKIGMDKPYVYTGPGGSGTDRICYLVPNESTYEGDPMWNRPFQFGTDSV